MHQPFNISDALFQLRCVARSRGQTGVIRMLRNKWLTKDYMIEDGECMQMLFSASRRCSQNIVRAESAVNSVSARTLL